MPHTTYSKLIVWLDWSWCYTKQKQKLTNTDCERWSYSIVGQRSFSANRNWLLLSSVHVHWNQAICPYLSYAKNVGGIEITISVQIFNLSMVFFGLKSPNLSKSIISNCYWCVIIGTSVQTFHVVIFWDQSIISSY